MATRLLCWFASVGLVAGAHACSSPSSDAAPPTGHDAASSAAAGAGFDASHATAGQGGGGVSNAPAIDARSDVTSRSDATPPVPGTEAGASDAQAEAAEDAPTVL